MTGNGAEPNHTARIVIGGIVALALLALAIRLVAGGQAAEPGEAPEARKVLEVQSRAPFQVLIPAYLPEAFDRAGVTVDASPAAVQLTYRTRTGAALYLRQWVPAAVEAEVLSASRPVETKWGRSWLRTQDEGLVALWVDVVPLRVALYTADPAVLPLEHLLAVADSLGPASNKRVFYTEVETHEVREAAPPPPVEIPVNAQGVQVVDLIVTPAGYSPLRFSVKAGVPVRLTFRQLGKVGCGNELLFPTGGGRIVTLILASAADRQALEFTPAEIGEFTFACPHEIYRGVMTVRD